MIDRINNYWSKRAEEFGEFLFYDLASPQRTVWTDFIRENLPKRDARIRALDTGTGAGFFAFILAELGCETVAVDYSQAMLKQARIGAEKLHYAPIDFLQMDAQNMTFEDGSFDFIISRNMTWTLSEPDRVYAEWYRLLTPGGVVLNIDANYGYVFKMADESGWTEKENAKWETSKYKFVGTEPSMVIERNTIAKQLSIASEVRTVGFE